MPVSFYPLDTRRDVRDILQKCFVKYLTPQMDLYDIGCGSKPFAGFLVGRVRNHTGIDVEDGFYDCRQADLIGSAYAVPVDAGVADAVLSSQVLEHLEEPEKALREAARILKEGGVLFLSFPFLYPAHALPRDYFRYTEFGARSLLESSGFHIEEIHRLSGFWYCLGVFAGNYFQALNRGWLKRFYIADSLNFVIRFFLFLAHSLEGKVLKVFGGEALLSSFRKVWTVNYVIVAKKRCADDNARG